MIRRILLPVAGDQPLDAAISCATQLAFRHGATLHLLGVIDRPGIERSAVGAGAGASHYAREMRQRRLADAREAYEETLNKLEESLHARGVAVRTAIETGAVHDVIAHYSRRTDLVVVGRDSNFQFETSEEPGETLVKLLRCSTRLTLVVPDGFDGEFERVIVAHDLSTTCSRVLYAMVHVNPFPDATYVVTHASPDGSSPDDEIEDIVDYMTKHGFDTTGEVRGGEPVEALLEAAERHDADALVLGAYDAGRVRRIFLGSVAQTVLAESKVPLLFGI
ncbi:MAG: universal stress protein [Myxococcales bacterium]|nr:universal stress protein [Myxococcales bacterium]